ncbi:MAG: Mut7-C RNAse domain-containing protein, partial [Planctomycetota bacterium]
MAEARFFCDDHLRRLARWLRAAGYDVAWQAAIDDDDLLARAGAEGRVVLTLDRALARRGGRGACLLPSHEPLAQLRFVKERYA